MLYQTLGVVDHLKIYGAYLKIENAIEWYGDRQSSLQVSNDGHSGTGKLQMSRDEHDYSILNPVFNGTVFEDLISEYKLFRTRLMWVKSKSCYSIHKDKTKRVHIPLMTNEQCMFLFPDKVELIHLPAGYSYLVDTRESHTFCNFSDSDRLHLVGCTDII